MKIHWRIDESNATHSRLTLFVAGKNCGQLCLGTPDLGHFLMIFRHGLSPTMDEYRESGESYDPAGTVER